MAKPNQTAVTAISAVVGTLLLLVLVQAITGGLTAREVGHSGLVNAHAGIAYLVAVLAVATVVIAAVMWRGKTGGQVVLIESVVLLVLVIIQIGLGQQIGKLSDKTGQHPGLLAVHIPVALLVFGVGLHLSTFVSNLKRSSR
jgi:hypothetical protein